MAEQRTVEQLAATASELAASIEQDVREVTDTIARLLAAEAAATGGQPTADPETLVALLLRESYEQTNEELAYYADKVKHYNDVKKALHELLDALRNLLQANEEMGKGSGSGATQTVSSPVAALPAEARVRRPGQPLPP